MQTPYGTTLRPVSTAARVRHSASSAHRRHFAYPAVARPHVCRPQAGSQGMEGAPALRLRTTDDAAECGAIDQIAGECTQRRWETAQGGTEDPSVQQRSNQALHDPPEEHCPEHTFQDGGARQVLW